MGGDVLVPEEEDDDAPTLGEIFEKQVAYYMSIGMTWDEYWHGDNILPRVYREKQEIERDRANYFAWLSGIYQSYAIGAAMSKDNKYPEEPIPLTEKQKQAQIDREYAKRVEMFKEQLLIEQEYREHGEL